MEKICRAGQATDDSIWRMLIACWVPKGTDTYSDYVRLIAFPLQQWLRERASVLHCRYMACLVHNMFATSCNDVTVSL